MPAKSPREELADDLTAVARECVGRGMHAEGAVLLTVAAALAEPEAEFREFFDLLHAYSRFRVEAAVARN